MQIQQYSAKQLEGMIRQFAFDGFQKLNECRELVDDWLFTVGKPMFATAYFAVLAVIFLVRDLGKKAKKNGGWNFYLPPPF